VVLRRLIRDFPSGAHFAEACALAGDHLRKLGQDTAAYQYYLAALDEAQTGLAAEAARRGVAAIEASQNRPTRWT